MLTQHLVALTNTINGMNPENEVILGRSSDLKDSVERSIERLQRQIKRWEKRIWKAGISLSPIKSKLYDMGRKKINNKKKKGGKKVLDTDLTARRSGQPEEIGHSSNQSSIKIKIKDKHKYTCRHIHRDKDSCEEENEILMLKVEGTLDM